MGGISRFDYLIVKKNFEKMLTIKNDFLKNAKFNMASRLLSTKNSDHSPKKYKQSLFKLVTLFLRRCEKDLSQKTKAYSTVILI